MQYREFTYLQCAHTGIPGAGPAVLP